MRNLGMGTTDRRDLIRVLLETLDFCEEIFEPGGNTGEINQLSSTGMTLYFWLVIFSFCVNPSSYNVTHPSNLFPNVPHYPSVPDDGDSASSRRDSSHKSRRDSLTSSPQQQPYNFIHPGSVAGGGGRSGQQASPSTSSSDVFTYQGIPVTQVQSNVVLVLSITTSSTILLWLREYIYVASYTNRNLSPF